MQTGHENEDFSFAIFVRLCRSTDVSLMSVHVFSLTKHPSTLSPTQQNGHSLPLQVTGTSVWPCEGCPAVSLFFLGSSQQSALGSTTPLGLQEHMGERK